MSFTVPDEVLREIAEQLKKQQPPSAANEDLRDAWFTIGLSVGSGGASLDGWITYWDDTKVHVTLAKVTAQTGTAAASTSIPVWVRIPPAAKLESPAVFEAGGFSLAAAVIMLKGIGNFPLVGVAPWDWHLAGVVNFEKTQS